MDDDDDAGPAWAPVCHHGMSEAACLDALLESNEALAEESILEQLAVHGIPARYAAVVLDATRDYREAAVRKALPAMVASMQLSATGAAVH